MMMMILMRSDGATEVKRDFRGVSLLRMIRAFASRFGSMLESKDIA